MITALRAQAKDPQRVNVFIEGEFALGVSLTTITKTGLHVGKQLSAEEYAKLTAAMSASSFGKATDPQVVTLLEARVRRVASELYAPEMAQNAIMDVHRGLVAMGWADWTSADVPDAAGDPYVVLACITLAPTFGVQFDVRLGVKAHQDLRRIIALPTSGIPVRAEYF